MNEKSVEQALRESEEKFRLVSQNPIVGIAWANTDGNLIDANEAFCKILHYNIEEIRGVSFRKFTHPDDVVKEDKLAKLIFEGKTDHYKIEKRYFTKEGETVWVELNLTCFKNEKGEIKYFIGIVVDIDARKKAEEALQQSEEQYRLITEWVPHIFWTSRPDGGSDYYNNNFLKYTGKTFEELKDWGWQKLVHPEDLEKCGAKVMESLNKGIPYEIELRLKRFDNQFRWQISRAIPFKDSNGNIIKWIGTCTDIHEQIENSEHLKSKNKELVKINNDLDNFVYAASHDLKAPVSNIEGLIEALKDTLGKENLKNKESDKIINMISLSTEKLKGALEDLSEVGRAQRNLAEDIEEINIRTMLDDVLIMLFKEIEISQTKIHIQIENQPTIKFSRYDFKSILYNLISNAIKYRDIQRPSEVWITTSQQEGNIHLQVKDNGLGIPEGKKDSIFGMFKRFHTHVPGSGIGLYIVKRIVDNNDGKIEVETKEGNGMTIDIYFRNTSPKKIFNF